MKREAAFDCLVAGDANIDLLVEGALHLEAGTEKIARDMNLLVGGSSCITACNLSRMGVKVRFAGIVGEDAFSAFVEEGLCSAGVDVRALRKSKAEKTGVTIWHREGGLRGGITYPGTISLLRSRDVSSELLASARHLHVGAYFLLEHLHAGAAGLFRRARKLGLTTSLDCNYDPRELWNSNIQEVLRYTDVFFPNEDEAMRLTGCATAEEAARKLARSARIAAVKLGSRGVFVSTREAGFHVPARKVRVVDTTGAGDSFNAGFLSGFLCGAGLQECARAGIAAASRCVSSMGGTAAFMAGL